MALADLPPDLEVEDVVVDRAGLDRDGEEEERDEDQHPVDEAIRGRVRRRSPLGELGIPSSQRQDDPEVQQAGDQDGPRGIPPEGEVGSVGTRGSGTTGDPVRECGPTRGNHHVERDQPECPAATSRSHRGALLRPAERRRGRTLAGADAPNRG